MLRLPQFSPATAPAGHLRPTALLRTCSVRPWALAHDPIRHPSVSRFRLCCPLPPCCLRPDSSGSWRAGEGENVDEDQFGDELGRLLDLLPGRLRQKLASHQELQELIEIVMDLGRMPLARFPSGDFVLSYEPITFQDIQYATSKVGDFAADNRAGISRTLHRISSIRNRKGVIVGLTCRVGRAIYGSADSLRDLIGDGGSVLLIGPPGVGKTTIIREIARMLADDYKKRVMIVDTSNEIGGDGDIPHPGIGDARRMQVPDASMQHKVLIEAVENHMPQAIVIDEIGTKLEAMAASTIAQRGIQLVATAHGITIENLIMNPSLEMLVGGIQSVTLGDEEANRRRVQKTVLERQGPSTFTYGVEIISKSEMRLHRSLEATVDAILAGRTPKVEVRQIKSNKVSDEDLSESESILGSHQEEKFAKDDLELNGGPTDDYTHTSRQLERDLDLPETLIFIRLYVYGILEDSVLQAINQAGMEDIVQLTDNISEADAFLALHAKIKKNTRMEGLAKYHELPIFVTKTSSLEHISKALRALINKHMEEQTHEIEDGDTSSEKMDALEEARLAIEQVVIPSGEAVELLRRPSHIICAQINLIRKYNLKFQKVGQDPDAFLRVIPFHHVTAVRSPKNLSSSPMEPFTVHNQVSSDSSYDGFGRLPLLPN